MLETYSYINTQVITKQVITSYTQAHGVKFLSLILFAQDDDFLDVVMGMLMPPVRTWNEETTSNTHYVTDVLVPEVNFSL